MSVSICLRQPAPGRPPLLPPNLRPLSNPSDSDIRVITSNSRNTMILRSSVCFFFVSAPMHVSCRQYTHQQRLRTHLVVVKVRLVCPLFAYRVL